MSGRMAGKRILLTGGASGIGRATAQRLIAEGGRIVFGDIDREAGERVAKGLRGAARFAPCDVTEEDDVRNLVDVASAELGGLDIVVNNAGMIVHRATIDLDVEIWDRVFAVNARSTFLVCKHAIPWLKRAGGGSIVNMSSMAGLRGAGGLSAYSSSKAAINGFTVALALELAADKIRANAVCPGWVDTSFNQPVIDFLGGAAGLAETIRSSIPLGRQGGVDEVAALVLYLASDESAFCTAQTISINGGAYN